MSTEGPLSTSGLLSLGLGFGLGCVSWFTNLVVLGFCHESLKSRCS